MSTFFRFYCTAENSMGGFFARYAWGTGMFDIVESFKYLNYCIKKHGTKSIRVISEHDDEYDENINVSNLIAMDDKTAIWRAQFLTFTRNIFPYSPEWISIPIDYNRDKDTKEDTRAEDWFNNERYHLLYDTIRHCSTETITTVWKEFLVSDLANNYSLPMSQQLKLFLDNNIKLCLDSDQSNEYNRRKKLEFESAKQKLYLIEELEHRLTEK